MLHGFGMVRKPVFLLRILIVLNTYKNTPTPFRYRNKQIFVYDRLVSVITLGKEREPGEDFYFFLRIIYFVQFLYLRHKRLEVLFLILIFDLECFPLINLLL